MPDWWPLVLLAVVLSVGFVLARSRLYRWLQEPQRRAHRAEQERLRAELRETRARLDRSVEDLRRAADPPGDDRGRPPG